MNNSLHPDLGNSGSPEEDLRYLRLGAKFPSYEGQECVCAAHLNAVVIGGYAATEDSKLLMEGNAVPVGFGSELV